LTNADIYYNGVNKRKDIMTLARFKNYIQYSTACPDGISLPRWKAMIKSAKSLI